MGCLYIEVYKCGKHLAVPLETLVVIFVLKYVKAFWLNIVLVEVECASTAFRLPESALSCFVTNFAKIEDVPSKVRNCFFPVIVKKEDRFYIAGLCAVLRYALKETSKLHSKGLCERLLGFRTGCLMACAEVSVWTKFCEIDILQVTKLIYTSIPTGDHRTTNIPTELLRLESHFRQPVRIHNKGKRQHELSKRKSKNNVSRSFSSASNRESNSASDNNQKSAGVHAESNGEYDVMDQLSVSLSSCNTSGDRHFQSKKQQQQLQQKKSLPSLHHRYAEGIDQTLADVILFSCIHYLLVVLSKHDLSGLPSQIPLVLDWYYCMIEEKALDEVVRDLELPPLPTQLRDLVSRKVTACDSTNVPMVKSNSATLKDSSSSLYIHDSKRSQVQSKNNIRQEDIERVMGQLEDYGIEVQYQSHPCTSVHLDWSALPQVVHPSFGELPSSRVLRKCQQVENLVSAVLKMVQPGDVIVDFCSGGGHLGIVIAYLLPHCQVIMIDNKEESLSRAFYRVEALGLHNATLYQTNLDYFRGSFTIGTSLHGCGVATDLVLLHCLKEKAAVVSCPCCYGAVKNTHLISYPKSAMLQKCGISYKDYCILGHAADQTHLNDPKTEQGQLCMGFIDTDRLQYLKENGYSTLLCTLNPPSCTPKNNLLTAWVPRVSHHR